MLKSVFPSRPSDLNVGIWGSLLALVLLGLVGVLGYASWQSYEARLAAARGDTERTALILEEQANSVILRADTALEHIADDLSAPEYGSLHAPQELHLYLKKLNSRFPELDNIRVIKPDGCSLAASAERDPGLCYADRSYYKNARDSALPVLWISEPIYGRSSHAWQIMLSRRINNPDGSFGGVVTARLTLSYFEKFFQSVHLGAGSSISLLDKDFRVVTRYPIDEGLRMKSAAGGPVERAARLHPDYGTTAGVSAVDGKERIFSYRRVGAYPLIITVGLGKEEVLAEWRNNTMVEFAVTLGLLLAIAWLARRFLQRYRSERDSQDRLREITATIGEGLYVVDGQGVISFVNPALCKVLGWEEGDVLGQESHRTFHHHKADGSDYASENCAVYLAVRNGKEYRSDDETFWRKDGTPLAVSVIASPIIRQGGVVGSVVTFQDITWRKKTEQQLIRFNETLSQRVAEEVAKNMERERLLIQQSRLAAMGEMIGNIAHQWRQPLNALGLLLANIKDSYEFGELNQEVLDDSIHTGRSLIQKMSSTIDDFRNFFKPNKEKERFRMEQSVQETLELLGHSLKNSNIEVQVEGESGSDIFGFPNEFSQVLLNIFSNAKDVIIEKQIRPGKIEVSLGHDAGSAWVTIRDNGGGIPEGILPRVFDPYFTTKEKGTGIGLYMSKIIIEDHMEGTVEARNTEDGAVFTIRCPNAV